MSITRYIRRRIVKKPSQIAMQELIRLTNQDKIYFSKQTQRLKCWDDIKKHLYMQSVICNMNLTPVILVHIDACIEYCKKYYKEDVEFFEDLKKQKYLYVSSDGQQRTWSMVEFVKGEVSMHEGLFHFIRYFHDNQISDPHFPYTDETETEFLPNFLEEKENTIFDFDAREMKFGDFSKEFQAEILNDFVPITIVYGCTRKDMSQIFHVVNISEPVNVQEFRNTFYVDIAPEVCVLGEEYLKYNDYLGKPEAGAKSDEFIVWLWEWYVSRRAIFDDNIDGYKGTNYFSYTKQTWMYKDGSEHYNKRLEFANILKKIYPSMDCLLVKKINAKGKESYDIKKPKGINWRWFLTFFQIMTRVLKTNKVLGGKKDMETIFKVFVRQELARRIDTSFCHKSNKGSNLVYSDMFSKSSDEYMNKVLQIAERDLLLDPVVSKLIKIKTSTLRKPKTIHDRIAAWIRQGGNPGINGEEYKPAIDPCDDHEISWEDMLNGELYELDHFIPLDKDGKDEPENIFLIHFEHHKKKGTRILDSYKDLLENTIGFVSIPSMVSSMAAS